MVKNYMESLVEDTLDKELDAHQTKYADLCRCGACMTTVKVQALNLLKPFYVTCIAGEIYGEYRSKEIQNNSDVLSAVVQGIEYTIYSGPHSAAPPQGHVQ